MGKLFDKLKQDVRFQEGLKACINCGTCTAICPAASFYNYDPRQIADSLQTYDENVLIELLKSETIWYCGECMSCKTRCPRGNTCGLIISALRALSQDTGYFAESEKGRQQLAIKRTIGKWILDYGYCIHPSVMEPKFHPEQGPTFAWVLDHSNEIYDRLGGNLGKDGPGILRKIPQESLDELHKIFEVTGALERFETLEKVSDAKAKEMGFEIDTDGLDNKYCHHIFTTNNNTHQQ